MKNIGILLGAGLVSFLTGCSTPPVAQAPVGPSPPSIARMAENGSLQVFSRLDSENEDPNQGSHDPAPGWHQHTDYRIYDMHGKLLKRVSNITGEFDQAPKTVSLPAGPYLVKAQAMDYTWVEVPVSIQCGGTTRIHLDGR